MTESTKFESPYQALLFLYKLALKGIDTGDFATIDKAYDVIFKSIKSKSNPLLQYNKELTDGKS